MRLIIRVRCEIVSVLKKLTHVDLTMQYAGITECCCMAEDIHVRFNGRFETTPPSTVWKLQEDRTRQPLCLSLSFPVNPGRPWVENRAGMFRVAGLNRLRAKQLSAAEVKRGLRRNVTGGGQNVIPAMSFYSPKVWQLLIPRNVFAASILVHFSPLKTARVLADKLFGISVESCL